jgi:uncharacterized protein (TIGR02172 family)
MNPTPPLASGRMAEIYPWDDGRVIKLFRTNWPEAAQHEFRIAKIASERGADTPRVYEVVQQDGRPGIIYERVQGISLLRVMAARPWLVIRLARQFAALHHTVHRCQAPELHAARPAVAKIIQEREELPPAMKASLLKLLETLPDGDALLHGDFHPDNVMVTPDKMLIVDWPNAARGCPLVDVARTTIMFRIGEPADATPLMRAMINILRTLFHQTYLRAYFAQSPYPLVELAPWEPIMAAHRLTDNIPGEPDKLIPFIHNRLAGLKVAG